MIAKLASKIAVRFNDVPCLNLNTCLIVLSNESGRDVDDLDVLFTFNEPFAIGEATGAVSESAKALLLSKQHLETVSAMRSLSDAERSAHPSWKYVMRNREFHIPALNRGQTATFNFWINSSTPTDVPQVQVFAVRFPQIFRFMSRSSSTELKFTSISKTETPVASGAEVAAVFLRRGNRC
jgi:hypothetical protein